MKMSTDFLDAHKRHWEDAELLFTAARWANADHLYGLAAECGLKRLMCAFGMEIDSASGSPARKKDRVHADCIWKRYEAYRSGRHDGVSYPLSSLEPFSDWNIAQRYAPQGDFTQEIAASHRDGAGKVYNLVKKAIWEGLIS